MVGVQNKIIAGERRCDFPALENEEVIYGSSEEHNVGLGDVTECWCLRRGGWFWF